MLDIENGQIDMQMGSGGRANNALIEEIFLSSFPPNPLPVTHNDQASFPIPKGKKISFTTDSHIVTPLFFSGSDIGELSVNGTINDLAVGGAEPKYLSASFIIEEGFPLKTLKAIADSIGNAARQTGISIVTGDTKVAEKGIFSGGVFINTTGIGWLDENINLAPENIEEGDFIISSGTLGEHEIAVLSSRQEIGFETEIISDCAPLHSLVKNMLNSVPNGAIKCMRDLTRGGLSAALNEIAEAGKVEILLQEEKIKVLPQVQAICDALGFDPLNLANEGKLIAFVKPDFANKILSVMNANPNGINASIIGEVTSKNFSTLLPKVKMHSISGGTRVVSWLYGSELPRIC